MRPHAGPVHGMRRYDKHLTEEAVHALELRLLQAINFQLVVFSPFRSLVGFLEDLKTSGGGKDADVVKASLLASLLAAAV